MFILLQNEDTLAFIGAAGEWTPDRAAARKFERGHEAVRYCVENRLTRMQVIYEFHEPKLNITLHLSPARSANSRNGEASPPLTGPGQLPPESLPRNQPPDVRSLGKT